VEPRKLRWTLLPISLLIASIAHAQTARPISPGQLIFNAPQQGPMQVQWVKMGNWFLTSGGPGEMITLFGTGLGPAAGAQPTPDDSGMIGTRLSGVEVLVGPFSAPIVYAGSTQVSAMVPYELSTISADRVTVLVKYLGQSSNGIQVRQAVSAPGIFTANSSGTGPGAILNTDNSYNGPGNPAGKGSVVQIFLTGEGPTNPVGVTGKITTVSSTGPLTPQPVLPVTVTIDGQPADIRFYGEAPGQVSGVLQINAEVPQNAKSGEVPLVVTFSNGGSSFSTQAGVTVSVR